MPMLITGNVSNNQTIPLILFNMMEWTGFASNYSTTQLQTFTIKLLNRIYALGAVANVAVVPK